MDVNKLKAGMEEEIRKAEKVLAFLENRAKGMPPGSLVINTINERDYVYQKISIDSRRYSLCLDPTLEAHRQVIRALMEKKVIVHGRPMLRRNIRAMEKCLNKLAVYNPTNYKYGNLLGQEYYLDGDICVKEWRGKEKSSQNRFHREDLIRRTKSGILVRSKSEEDIADALYDLGVEFRYEPALRLERRTVYPDFEILHPKKHKLVWWEHFGGLDDPAYTLRNMYKIAEYGKAGITPGNNLIITCETKAMLLTRDVINHALKENGLISS